ncbi:MAG: hypothetical protein CL537_08905 [Alcanivoracaceae bacterium]|uniref:hypothetical protein n=1 Tax=Alcanivorax sp. MD8A TaxID=1177157 RepID=UPI000C58EF3B|nr:hypothetical protein [Alcanivorax sp. MD8A]MAX55610.1 hypothetical protein [Alcanivoracaceae bacterium]MED5432676.1 hypothetical protein [Pseudomonadota bacterium]MEE2869267.1 hypothetical protein [Pseudomonadota bacterium]PNE03801.1 hypothetical protein A15D_00717 [Alcanivorax sp. MD8A]|tara:strand:+ start:2692 stop:3084 length:393 start_codon:yes stop_codon:yes gene_type:complete
MITYLYWFLVAALVIAALVGIGARAGKWKPAIIIAVIIWLVSTLAYYFWLQQVFVKRFGGTMSITIPEEHYHLNATWKDDNLWIEDYDPATNECIFREYSRGNMLQGRVVLKNCNPLGARNLPAAPAAAQ